MPRDDSRRTRRRFLTASGALGFSATLAGCSGEFSGEFDDAAEPGTEPDGVTETPTDADEPLPYGVTGEFTLERGDGTDPDGDLARPVTFQGSRGDSVVITMASEAFDTHLMLEGPNGAVVAENDDIEFLTNTDSRIRTTLGATGTYTVWCGSFDGGTGPFTLSLERAASTGSTATGSGGVSAASITYGESRTFTLERGDGRDPRYADLAKPVTFDGTSGDRVTITMESGAFDAYLVLEDPNGSIVTQNNDISGAGGTDSQIRLTLSESGAYTIWAGSLSGDATGSFTLSLERASRAG